MTIGASWLGGLGLGAALMFLLDPDRGRRRRAMLRDGVASRAGGSTTFLRKSGHDVGNRAKGLAARARRLARRDGPVEDEVLVERVRAKIGRYVSHPGMIAVFADEGDVVLKGPVLADEVEDLLSAVRSVRGVRYVEDRLEVHENGGDVPGLGGTGRRHGETAEFRQEHWSPAARLAAGTAGGALFLAGLRRRGALGWAVSTVGTGLLARSVTNKSGRRLGGFGARSSANGDPIAVEPEDTTFAPRSTETESEDWAV
jgi:hypothetical protein